MGIENKFMSSIDKATIMNLEPDGSLKIEIQLERNLKEKELECFKEKFSRYSLFEYKNTAVCWAFKFPKPINTIKCFFHIGLYKDDRVTKYIKSKSKTIKFRIFDGGNETDPKKEWVSNIKKKDITTFKNILKKQHPIQKYEYDNVMDQCKSKQKLEFDYNWILKYLYIFPLEKDSNLPQKKEVKYLNKARMRFVFYMLLVWGEINILLYVFAYPYFLTIFSSLWLFNFAWACFGLAVLLFHTAYEYKIYQSRYFLPHITLILPLFSIATLFLIFIGMHYFKDASYLQCFYIFTSFTIGFGIDGLIGRMKKFDYK